ncbi:MAG: DtxR family transcriptional regulator [Deltaproteobacteria bacterium]|nr:MAG: DtxR family transcriptional regulator [Deltaproteobacteria bacterium]
MTRGDALTASQEDYLEAIFHISSEKHAARAGDIAKRLKVNASSVTGALRVLSDKGLINYAPYDLITLTPAGREVATDVIRRHEVLRDFFIRVLDVDEKAAGEGACGMEHSVPRIVLDRLVKFLEFMELCPRAGIDLIRAFRTYYEKGMDEAACVRCVFQCLEDLKGKRRQEVEEGKLTVPLSRLNRAQKGKIIRIKGRGDTRKRIIQMGFSPGSLVEMEHAGEGETPVECKVKGYHLTLRKDEAKRIVVEVVPGTAP